MGNVEQIWQRKWRSSRANLHKTLIHISKRKQNASNTGKLNLSIWHFAAQTLSRQIDCFVIPTPRRNWVKTIKTTKSDLEIANTREPAQHRILQIYIQISLKTNNANIQSNNTIPYNIKALRKEPQNADENSLILKTIWPYTQPPKRYCVGNS